MKQIDITDITADIERCHHHIKSLQHSTIECVSFGATGKLTVIDKPRLEELNAEVGRLTELAENNEKVLSKLEEALGAFPTIAAMLERKRYLNEGIARVHNLLRQDVANLTKKRADIDPGKPYDHPEGKRLKDQADARLADLQPQLAALDEQIAKAETILQEFQSSGLQPAPTTASTAPSLISRAKVSGMGI